MEVHEGEIVTIIGANGAGKSTLLNAITGFLKPVTGRGGLQGPAPRPQPGRIVKLGICHVPEGRLVFANLTVRTTWKLGAYLRTRPQGRSPRPGAGLPAVPAPARSA